MYLEALDSCRVQGILREDNPIIQCMDRVLRLDSVDSFPQLLEMLIQTVQQRFFALATQIALGLAHAAFCFHEVPVVIMKTFEIDPFACTPLFAAPRFHSESESSVCFLPCCDGFRPTTL